MKLLMLLFILFYNLFSYNNDYHYCISDKDLIELSKVKNPIIKKLSWGKISCIISNQEKEFNDVIITPKKIINWDWNKTGTKHFPGIQIACLQDIIDEAEIFILSQGMGLVLQITDEAINFLKSKNKVFYILQSCKAAKLYNELVKSGKNVAILMHTTC